MSQPSAAVRALERDLREIFGARLQSFVAYGVGGRPDGHDRTHAAGHQEPPVTHTMAIADTLTVDDLRDCMGRVRTWHDTGLATPLLLAAHELERALDVFPLEFGAIVADHVLVSGRNPFDGLAVDPGNVRRACEMQARSHLLHLRGGYLETGGNADALAVLIVRSAAPFAALLASVARLQGLETHDAAAVGRHIERAVSLPGIVTDVIKLARVKEITAAEATRIFPAYLDAVGRLVKYIDDWGARQ